VIFSTIEFFTFFAVVFPTALLLRNTRYFHFYLLLASCYFYMSWNPAFIFLLFASALIDYLAAPKIMEASSQRTKKQWLVVAMGLNLGLLGFFKYANFFANGINWACDRWFQIPHLNVTLPVGISFYTFQSMSYSLDAYFGKITRERSFIKFALYVSFFPQLVAGPIVRAQEFLPQLYRSLTVSLDNIKHGLQRFVIGLVKKLLIADALAPYVDRIFANPAQYDAATLWLGALAFGIQIYCDFSGYSDMAIGTAKCFGYVFPENFNMPYFATNIRAFWQRWHMTLSRWLRDYLFIPLGGSWCSESMIVRNLMITMLLGGLWHGADWRFVIWGGLHGGYLVLYRTWANIKRRTNLATRIPIKKLTAVISACITFFVVTLTWVYFRAADASVATAMVRRMLMFDSTGEFVPSPLLMICLVVMFVSHLVATFADHEALYRKLPTPFKVVGYGVIFYLISISSIQDNTPFIYFQF